MEKEKKFLLKQLELLKTIVPKVNCSYSFEKDTNYHIIEVFPESIRRGSDAYINWERQLWKDFCETYQDEDLLITNPLSENDNEIIYEYKGFENNKQRIVFIKEYKTSMSSFMESTNINYALAA